MKLSISAVCFCLLFIFSACASSQSQPSWVRNPYNKYDRQIHAAAVGSGIDRQSAEKNALGNLVAFFGQSIQVDERVSVTYRETVRNGVSAGWIENTSVNNDIITSAGMDSLIGAEIGEAWFDGKNTHYAIAVLNKANANRAYSELIRSNQRIIDNLINIPANQKNTMEGFVRYRTAAAIADINSSYASLLSLLGFSSLQNIKNGDEYRLEAQNISQAIPINVRVRNDRQGRIQNAFAKILTDMGFRTGGTNSRYIIDVDITTSSADVPNNSVRFIRIELKADFIDTNNRAVLVSYSLNEREGHSTVEAATNRVFLTTERRIETEFRELLDRYLLRMLPRLNI